MELKQLTIYIYKVLVGGKSIIINQLWLLFSFFKIHLITVG